MAQRGSNFDIRVDDGAVGLDGVVITSSASAKGKAPIAVEKIRIDGVRMELVKQTLRIRRVSLANGRVAVQRSLSGEMNLVSLFVPKATRSTSGAPPPASKATRTSTAARSKPGWRVRVDEVALRAVDVEAEQMTDHGPVQLVLEKLAARAQKFQLPELTPFPVQLDTGISSGGRLAVTATIAVKPSFSIRSRVDLKGLDLSQGQPLVRSAAALELKSARLSINGRVRYPETQDAPLFDGGLQLDAVETVDLRSGRRFVGLKQLKYRA